MKQKKIFALGFFDGVHLGHQALLTACSHLARRSGCKNGVVTFDSHPDALVTNQAPPLINTIADRCRIFLAHGFADYLILPFNEELMQTPWQTFLENLIQQGAGGFVCGDDFRFGHKGQGNAENLAQFCRDRGLPYAIVPEQTMDGEKISSTRIRKALEAGDLECANRLLGHPHMLTGTVVPGRQLGRTIGIPTANLHPEEALIIPPMGVYATRCRIGEEIYTAVTNIGTRPTVSGQGVTIEPWILDFDGDLYGKEITLYFHKFLRPEQKFPNLEELKAEILKNAAEVRKIFEN